MNIPTSAMLTVVRHLLAISFKFRCDKLKQSQKYFWFFLILLLFNRCAFDSFESNLERINKKALNDSTDIELYYGGGGATAPDVIWVRRIVKNKQQYIGKIKWSGTEWYKTDIEQVNDTLIKIRITDTLNWKGRFREFIISINNRIEPNDGSMYADGTY